MSYLSRRTREETRWSGIRGALSHERIEALSGMGHLQLAMLREMRGPIERELERRFIGSIHGWQPHGIEQAAAIDFRGRVG